MEDNKKEVLPLTHEKLVFKLIEPYSNEWSRLSMDVRVLMVKHPAMFALLDNDKPGIPRIKYGDVIFRYHQTHAVWVVDSIISTDISCPF